jgi:SAM-dependent methyltransferase
VATLKSFDRVAGIYDATRAFPPEAEGVIAAGLAALLPPGTRVVEVGVGTGRVAVPLAREGVPVVGFDISPKMLAILRAKGSTVVPLLAEATRQPFRDGAFEAGLFVHILHLVPDVAATVRETARVVRPGGLLLACATTHIPGPAHLASEEIRRVTAEVTGIRPPPFNSNDRSIVGAQQVDRSEPPFRRIMAELGAALEEHELVRWRSPMTARRLLDELRNQVHSQTWVIPPGALAGIAERAEPGVVAAMGGMDNEVAEEQIFRVLRARLPG